jgi:membrane protease YdiL (CAAX protease family)
VSGQPRRLLDDASAEGVVKSLVWVIPSVLVLIAIRRLSLHEAWRELGLDSSAARGYAFGLLATLPMVLALPFGPAYSIEPAVFVGTVLLGPFAEEVLFRGFLFKQLLTRARWPLPWAIGVSAVVFALTHHPYVDSGIAAYFTRPHGRSDLLVGIGATIAMFAPGGALFAWVVYRFGSLWPAIGLHACLNLWWMVSHGPDARGVFTLDASGIAQVLALGLAFLLTLRKPRRALVIEQSAIGN